MKKIYVSQLKPIGNFDEVLTSLIKWANDIITKCEDDGAYRPSLAKWIKFTIGEMDVPGALLEGIQKNTAWDIEEAKQCLLVFYYTFIRINYTAHSYLNPTINIPGVFEQFQDYVRDNKAIYGKVEVLP